jgi:hypothetical protein
MEKIAYLIPNIPRFEVDREKFWIWWNSVNIPIKRIQKDSRGHAGGYDGEFWDGVTIWQKPSYQKNIVWEVNYKPNPDLFDNLTEQIIKNIPWFDIEGITLWSNKKAIGAHQDGKPRDIFPSAPRIMLFDECDNRTFYIVHKDPFKIFFPNLTTGPNLFFFNNEKFFHGASTPVNGKKILIRIDGPLIDPDGLTEFLKNQVQNNAKYEEI